MTPTLSELDTLKLENALLTFENLRLQLEAMQITVQQHREAFNALAQSFHQDGYQLPRAAHGVWIYQSVPVSNEAR
jgi:hypothetical protein